MLFTNINSKSQILVNSISWFEVIVLSHILQASQPGMNTSNNVNVKARPKPEPRPVIPSQDDGRFVFIHYSELVLMA